MIRKVVSGGQTGADRAAWDAALKAGIKIEGYVPRGRMAEDGPIPDRYHGLTETEAEDPAERTRQNVIHSDGTLVLTHGRPAGGTMLTIRCAEESSRALLHFDLSVTRLEEGAEMVRSWLRSNNIRVLNVAGPRASEDGSIYEQTLEFLGKLLDPYGRW